MTEPGGGWGREERNILGCLEVVLVLVFNISINISISSSIIISFSSSNSSSLSICILVLLLVHKFTDWDLFTQLFAYCQSPFQINKFCTDHGQFSLTSNVQIL